MSNFQEALLLRLVDLLASVPQREATGLAKPKLRLPLSARRTSSPSAEGIVDGLENSRTMHLV